MLFTDVSTARAQKAFEKVGFKVIRQGKHTVMSDGARYLTLPRHNPINPYTLRTLIRAAGLSDEQFKELL
ncbi:MAG TPA: type II toxin-antitoxin system HicA family toxin [Armatimonadota bacterium]|nr:type II toxin-antitoxin system HicA family toxin [Armatimonadota bacterium]